jgi:hypothetical protein
MRGIIMSERGTLKYEMYRKYQRSNFSLAVEIYKGMIERL